MSKKNSSVRKAKPADIDTIHKLLDIEPFKYDDDLPYDRSWIEGMVCNKRCITLVYETDGIIKGFISGERLISGMVLLWFCAVKPEYQHRTIGIKLYMAFELKCKKKGAHAILSYGYKTSANMLERLNFHTDHKTYKEFYKPLNHLL
jgi:N-acetylglutamate synthase-like GNAT family acetyltransferase